MWSFEYRHISCYVFTRNVLPYVLDRFCDDTGLLCSCFAAGKAKHFPAMAFAYRQRSGGISGTSDETELNLLEMLLFQDVQNRNYYPKSTLAKFYRPILYVYKHRIELRNNKYEKYLIESKNTRMIYLINWYVMMN